MIDPQPDRKTEIASVDVHPGASYAGPTASHAGPVTWAGVKASEAYDTRSLPLARLENSRVAGPSASQGSFLGGAERGLTTATLQVWN